MTHLGIPIPPGFVISTSALTDFIKFKGRHPNTHYEYEDQNLREELIIHIKKLEKTTDKIFFYENPTSKNKLPLLLAIRSSDVSLQHTILNLGLNQERVKTMARVSKDPRWAYENYSKFIRMYGQVVLKISSCKYDESLLKILKKNKLTRHQELNEVGMIQLCREYLEFTDIPIDPLQQLISAILSIFETTFKLYNEAIVAASNVASSILVSSSPNSNISTSISIIIQNMVYGNYNLDSGIGLAYTRCPITGEKGLFGEYYRGQTSNELFKKKGQKNNKDFFDLSQLYPIAFETLFQAEKLLEKLKKDLIEIEFIIEDRNIYIIKINRALRTGKAAVKIAVDMVNENLINEREALRRIQPKLLKDFIYYSIDYKKCEIEKINLEENIFSHGLVTSPGVVTGKLILHEDDIVDCEEEGIVSIYAKDYIDVEYEEKYIKMTSGVITTSGGVNSKLSKLCNELNKPLLILGNENFINKQSLKIINLSNKNLVLNTNDTITLDGTNGILYKTKLPLVPPGGSNEFKKINEWSNKFKGARIFANVDEVDDLLFALEIGAEGIGLFPTEKMLMKEENIILFSQMILTRDKDEVEGIVSTLSNSLHYEFIEIFRVMHKKVITIRLFDKELSSFLPKDLLYSELCPNNETLFNDLTKNFLKNKINETQERNAILASRGCRLAIIFPEIIKCQMMAIISAVKEVEKEHIIVRLRLLLPLAFCEHEIDALITIINDVFREMGYSKRGSLMEKQGSNIEDKGDEPIKQVEIDDNISDEEKDQIRIEYGAVIEVPRACLHADKFAKHEEITFLSFDLKALTQLMFGISEVDSHLFMNNYVKNHILEANPFESLDDAGIGRLIHLAMRKCKNLKQTIKEFNKNLRFSIIGEHSICGDAKSISFLYNQGII